MYLAIFDYLERIFAAVRQRKLLYGDRRRRAAREDEPAALAPLPLGAGLEKEEEEERLRAEWAAEGRAVPPSARAGVRFQRDPPGTPFMDRLAVFLRAFTHKKISSDPGWKGIKVILSDGSVPGERERSCSSSGCSGCSGYQAEHATASTASADLIMLSLATHEPLHDPPQYVDPAKSAPAPALTDVVEAELTRRRRRRPTAARQGRKGGGETDALQPSTCASSRVPVQEFCQADYSAEGGFDLERLLDDFVFMCFFVDGNFLPHLPSLDIREGGIDTLFDLYKSGFNDRGGWICDGGKVDLERARLFCVELGKLEDELLARKRVGQEVQGAPQEEDAEVAGRVLENHRSMLQRVAETRRRRAPPRTCRRCAANRTQRS